MNSCCRDAPSQLSPSAHTEVHAPQLTHMACNYRLHYRIDEAVITSTNPVNGIITDRGVPQPASRKPPSPDPTHKEKINRVACISHSRQASFGSGPLLVYNPLPVFCEILHLSFLSGIQPAAFPLHLVSQQPRQALVRHREVVVTPNSAVQIAPNPQIWQFHTNKSPIADRTPNSAILLCHRSTTWPTHSHPFPVPQDKTRRNETGQDAEIDETEQTNLESSHGRVALILLFVMRLDKEASCQV